MPKAKTTKKTAAPNKKISGLKTAMTKTEIIAELVDKTELSKKEIQSVLDEIRNEHEITSGFKVF